MRGGAAICACTHFRGVRHLSLSAASWLEETLTRSNVCDGPSTIKNKFTTAGMSKDLSSVTILKTDTPRTRDLKTLRAKRLAYFVDRNHNCTNLSRDVGSLGHNDKQINIDHRVADPQRENVLNAEQNVPLVEKECHINELIQHTRAEDTRQVHSRDLETLLNITESDGKDACTPRPDYNFLENPSVSEIQKLRHILCWAQEILKKDKNDSHAQEHQSIMNINETELAESHLNPDAPQTTTFNCSTHTNKFVHKAAVNSAFDEAKCSAGISFESFDSFDLLRPHRNLVPISSFMTVQNDVEEQSMSTNIGLSGNCHFDSSNTFERKYTKQVHTYNTSNNKWKFKDSGESKELMTELPNETCHSMTSNISALNKGNYFWIPLEAGSDDEYITENRQVNEAFMEPFVKSNITPLLCSSNNNYHNNNGEPTLSARTVTLRKCPGTFNNSGEILGKPVNLHYMIQHHISSNNQNKNGESTLSARAVTLKKSPVEYSGDIFATPFNKHNIALHCKSTYCDEGKRNYAWETKKAEEYFSGGDYEISLGHSKIAGVPGLSPNLDDAGFNFKSPFALKCTIESSNEKITVNEQDKGTKVDKASQGRANSDQFPEKFRNLCITDASKTLISHSSGSPKYCSDIIMDSRWSENLPDLTILNKKANSNNDENEVRYQTSKCKAQNTLKLSPLSMLSYDFNDSKTSSITFEKEEPIESVGSQIADENRSSFLHANNLVKHCPECKSDNSSAVNWCTECGCVLIAITSQLCNATSNIDGRAFSNSRGSSNKEKIVVGGLKEKSEIEEYEIDDVNNLENSTCFSLEMSESQLSVYQKYLLYMDHLEKIRSQHQTREQQPTDVLLVKENTNQTETVDENNSTYGKHEPENSSTTSFVLPTHFREQTDSKYIVYEQDSEDNPIPNPDIVTVPLVENIPGVSILHSTFQEKSYLEQDSNVETSKNIMHSATLKQNFGNQNFSSLEYENNKETLKDAEKKPRKKRKIQSSINQYQRCWEKSSIAWSSYTQGAIKARSTNVSHPRSVADCPRTKGKPLLPDDRSTVPMAMSKGSLKQPFKRPLSANILDNKQGRQERQRSKTLLQNAAVASGPTMKPRVLTKYFKSDVSHSYDKLICPGDGNALPWLYLPDEIWIRIFTLLSHQDLFQVLQVCYRFYHLANDEILWKNIKVENCNCLNDECLKNIGRRKPQNLSLLRCDDRIKSITDSGLRLLFKHSKDSLKELYVSCCSGPKLTGDSILLHASAICCNLASVDVSWTAATDEGIIELTQASSWLLANGCHLTDESINILVKKHGKSLRELEVFGCHALSSQCLTHVAQECLNLQILNIGRIPKLTTACLTWIVTNLKDLSTLNLSGLNAVHDSVVHHIARRCPKMDRLILSSCPQMTDVSLFEIGTYLSTIRYLDVSGCKKVTDAGVQALAVSCHKLQYLDLSSTAVGKYGICLLATYCNQNLECVKLSFCKEITEDAIKKLCKNSKRLKLLHLYGCQSVINLKAIQDVNKQVKLHHDQVSKK